MTTPESGRRRPELIAPAGDWDCLRAAVENGADAVYFGLDCGFNARMRAANFKADELPAAIVFLHRRGVKGYVAINTLVFPSELEQVERILRSVAQSGADAVLLQDLGLVRLVRMLCPELAIHASTQMTLTSAEGIEVVRRLGVDRVVLARELSIPQIRQIRSATDVSLEVFVHGALCVAYSGQCLTSESLGGRSANRGECAQACRLPYELVCDGRDVDLGKVKYLLSPQDLAAFGLVPDLIAAGVDGLKIEGRLKKPEYVANITRHYRQAVDAALAGHPTEFTPRQIEEMELSFSRGFSPGWLLGNDPKRLVPGLSSAKRGVYLGEVASVDGPRVQVTLASGLAPGDGVVFEGDRSHNNEQGGRVLAIYRGRERLESSAGNACVELTFARGAVDVRNLRVGQSVWKTDDPHLTRRLLETFRHGYATRKVPLDLCVHAAVGKKLAIFGQAETGATCRVESDEPLAAAIQRPLTEELLRAQLDRLGRTIYRLRRLELHIEGSPMAPLSVLGKLRRALIEQLDAWRDPRCDRTLPAASVLPVLRAELPLATGPETSRSNAGSNSTGESTNGAPELRVLCRSLEQIEAAVSLGISRVVADFQDIRQYREAVTLARSRGAEVFLATPRIQKPGELGIFRALNRHAADGILARNLAAVAFFADRESRIVADFSLNAANELSVHYLRGQGAEQVTASYDLHRDQLLELVAAVPPPWLEVVVHQHMPLFHMEHCVFCAVLSPGRDKTDCGRPCDRHLVQLRDRIGAEHPLKADVACRNSLFNAVPQSGAEVIPRLIQLGVRHFRVELLDNDRPSAEKTIRLYEQLLAGKTGGRQVWRALQAANRVGVTRGTLEERRNPLALV